MEYFDIVDENGNPTGRTIERAEAHRIGALHRTSHVWIVRRRQDAIQILLQKRSMDKDSFPGCYDISSAGHIPAGEDYVPSALRELKEELGVAAEPSALIDCGLKFLEMRDSFHGKPYIDRQISRVFLLWLDCEAEDFTVQKEELESVMWMDFDACKEAVETGTIPNCVDIRELEMLERYL